MCHAVIPKRQTHNQALLGDDLPHHANGNNPLLEGVRPYGTTGNDEITQGTHSLCVMIATGYVRVCIQPMTQQSKGARWERGNIWCWPAERNTMDPKSI